MNEGTVGVEVFGRVEGLHPHRPQLLEGESLLGWREEGAFLCELDETMSGSICNIIELEED